MTIFLIAGKAGSGKNEVASLLQKHLENTVVTGFAKYIKLFALEFTNWDGKDETKPRTFLQEMGDTLRKIDPNFLVDRIIQDFKVYEKIFDTVVVSDIRLPYELETIKNNTNHKVVTIKVTASKSARILAEQEMKHHTELALENYDNFDYVIENNFDKNLEKDVLKIIEGMK